MAEFAMYIKIKSNNAKQQTFVGEITSRNSCVFRLKMANKGRNM
jgi:hypothetical protein